MIFDDVALRDMARRRPTTLGSFHRVRGVGEKKLADFGDEFTKCIREYCAANEVDTDIE